MIAERRAAEVTPAVCKASARKSAMFLTRATRRCSTAPAEALHTAAVTSAARRSAITTPAAPTHSAVRQIDPTFWGSWS